MENENIENKYKWLNLHFRLCSDFETLLEYEKLMEQQLTAKLKHFELENNFESIDTEDERYLGVIFQEIQLSSTYPDLFRSTLLTQIISVFEGNLKVLAKTLCDLKGVKFPEDLTQGNDIIRRLRECIENKAPLKLANRRCWNLITDCVKIRHSIIHDRANCMVSDPVYAIAKKYDSLEVSLNDQKTQAVFSFKDGELNQRLINTLHDFFKDIVSELREMDINNKLL